MSAAHQAGPFENGAARLPIDQQRSIVRVFVSSPSDVDLERKVTERVINRLQAKVAARGEILAYFWEFEPMSNYQTFQAQIPDSNEFDIVICILWSRLGTPLVAPDGKRYRSGTEYEVISSRAAWRANGRPDLMIYINTAPAQIRQFPDAEFERSIGDLRALKDFIAEYCRDPITGENKGAYTTYSELGQFEQLVERHLEKLFDEKLPVQRTGSGAKADQHLVWGRRSPFRGLEAFDFEHAPVFFGRTKAIGEVVTRLRKRMSEVEDARAARLPGVEIEPAAFLLVSAMSGVGKSSLIRAGVLPLMVEPGNGAAPWRRALMRPSEATGDLFDGLARALCRPEALPELVSSDVSVDSIADLLRRNPAGIEFGLVTALDQAAGTIRRAEPPGFESTGAAGPDLVQVSTPRLTRLILFIDQLEELFTLERINDQERAGFITALAAVARSGKAYVIATLRSDFFGRCAELPLLAELSQGDGLYHLLPPSNSELSQIIKQPATAAGLEFEVHPETKESLDDRLRDAAIRNPEALPLLQFCLEELYRAQAGRGDGLLTHHDYEAMGGVEGSLARRAEDVFLSLDAEAQAQFDHVMRRITAVVIEEAGAFNRRWADYNELTKPPGAKAFVDAFLDPAARLFVIDRTDAGQVVVSVTHEALLTHWERLFRWLVENRESLLTRAQVSADARRWLESGKNADYLYRAGLPLVKAQKTLAEGFLDSTERDFVDSSTMRAHAEFIRNRRVTQVVIGGISAALVLALVLAGFAFRQSRQAGKAKARADQEAKRANLARTEAEKLINFMTTDLRDKLKPIGRLDLLADVNNRVEEYYSAFPATDERPEIQRQRGTALTNEGDVFLDEGKMADALKAYQQALGIRQELTKLAPNNTDMKSDLAQIQEKIGDVAQRQGNLAEAERNCRSALVIRSELVSEEPDQPERLHGLFFVTARIGFLVATRGDSVGAEELYKDAVELGEKLLSRNQATGGVLQDLSLVYLRLTEVSLAKGNLNEALDRAQKSLKMRRALVGEDTNNAAYQRDLGTSLEKVGEVLSQKGELNQAMNNFQDCLEIRKKLIERDPTNEHWQNDLALSYEDLALILQGRGQIDEAIDNFRKCLGIRERLAISDKTSTELERNLFIIYLEIGQPLLDRGQFEEAARDYRHALEICHRLTGLDPSNSRWQRDMAFAYDGVGDALKEQARVEEALKMYREALSIRTSLVMRDGKNANWESDLAWSHNEIGMALTLARSYSEAEGEFKVSLTIYQKVVDQAPLASGWKNDFAMAREKLGELLFKEGKTEAALTSFQTAIEATKKLLDLDPQDVVAASTFSSASLFIAQIFEKSGSADRTAIRAVLEKAKQVLLSVTRRTTLSIRDEACLQKIEAALNNF